MLLACLLLFSYEFWLAGWLAAVVLENECMDIKGLKSCCGRG
jgi:hypothetical protein